MEAALRIPSATNQSPAIYANDRSGFEVTRVQGGVERQRDEAKPGENRDATLSAESPGKRADQKRR